MRVRTLMRQTDARRSPRREHTAPRPSAPAPRPAAPKLEAERRLRASGGPDDRAHYRCACGFQFEANVSTSVSCPHCGAAQAW
jgi:hypothetical protein